MTPRVLLLQENQASGGVSTISDTLCQALRRHGWSVRELALNRCGWRQGLTASRHCDVIVACNNFKPAYVAWLIGVLLRKPVVVWVHGPLQDVLDLAQASVLKRAWLRWLYRHLAQFVFVSQASRASFERFMGTPWAAHQHSKVIANAVALPGLPGNRVAAEDAAVPEPQLAYIGRLSQEKQPQLLLDMLRLLPDKFRLTLVGDGPLRDAVRQAGADLLASGRLTLAGPQAHAASLYTPWHLTLLASRYEGCPMTLLESLSAGVACVGLPIAALQEVLGADAAYLLARDTSAQALADAVQTVLALPHQQLQDDMLRVLARHQVTDFVQHWQAVLQQAVQPC
ncbi:4-alpha-N-acetylgalactosaminyltransferase [mine drainage metagenome]|uniref:4-alpha-N-acetylgalactosaminyltransferase n=1 Tax=mine drainage metagenome TaxID=410659 RepID=A0A1J5QCP5_9ZZZZ